MTETEIVCKLTHNFISWKKIIDSHIRLLTLVLFSIESVPLKGKERKVAGEERKTVIQTQCVI
jgi:hypothetical protein